MRYIDPTPVSSITWTMGILIAAVVLLIVWEVVVLVNPQDGDTISEVTLYWSRRHPVVPFLVGVLCGHWFWTQRVCDESLPADMGGEDARHPEP